MKTRIRFSEIQRAAKNRPEGYLDDVLSSGHRQGEWVVFDNQVLESLRIKYAAAQRISRSEWPAWAKSLALLANKTDAGLGDVIERVVGPIGGNVFKVWYKRVTGRDCGCAARKATLNARWPLKSN